MDSRLAFNFDSYTGTLVKLKDRAAKNVDSIKSSFKHYHAHKGQFLADIFLHIFCGFNTDHGEADFWS